MYLQKKIKDKYVFRFFIIVVVYTILFVIFTKGAS
jgi:hypothetical protein